MTNIATFKVPQPKPQLATHICPSRQQTYAYISLQTVRFLNVISSEGPQTANYRTQKNATFLRSYVRRSVFPSVYTSTARLVASHPQWELGFQSDTNWIYNNLITEKFTYLFLDSVSCLNDLLARVTCRLYYGFLDELIKHRAYSNPSFKVIFTIYYYFPCCHLFVRYLQLYTWNKPCF
jgi:hypothetical protein